MMGIYFFFAKNMSSVGFSCRLSDFRSQSIFFEYNKFLKKKIKERDGKIKNMNLSVKITTLENGIKSGRESEKLIKSDMEKVFSTIEELDKMWDGPASEAFNKQVEKDREIFELILQNIDEILGSMTSSKDLYNRCETSVDSRIKSIKI